ncbi:MAG: SEC-C domain-containing protein [Sedimentisphaerales bacterium]|nr:SEC-C domain-containing protein [Sedimentisphaerales bacterium]
MAEKQRKIVGRNELCPCGSGRKYKKCHGNTNGISTTASFPFNHADIKQKLKQIEAKDIQRTQQQGLGRSIISTVFKGYRFVAVGSRFYYSKTWETFHDFLAEYIKLLFGKEWGSSEQKKTLENRHPILRWTHTISTYRKKILDENNGNIISSPMTGAVFAYLTLAYNLYLIAHNIQLVHGKGLHARLIERLKNKDSFYPAFYETMVAASFIKAGFQIELENENDSSSDHAEFTATSPKTKKKYSVEAKHRQANKGHTGISRQIYNALKKDLLHERVVFINLNMQINQVNNGKLGWLDNVIGEMRQLENSELDGKPAPQAYIFVTNHPFLYNLDSFEFPPAAVAEGFKIPDFKLDTAFSNLREALKSREKHIDMLDLMQAMREYDQIPQTFDGEIPEYAFGEIKEPRLKIGNKYLVPGSSGQEVAGILEDAVVMENEKKVFGLYRLENGQQIMATCPLFDKEFKAFKQYPDTFFGVYKKHRNETRDPLELFDFFYGVYRRSSKDKLLEFLKGHPQLEKLQKETQEELAMIYCEHLVYAARSKSPS